MVCSNKQWAEGAALCAADRCALREPTQVPVDTWSGVRIATSLETRAVRRKKAAVPTWQSMAMQYIVLFNIPRHPSANSPSHLGGHSEGRRDELLKALDVGEVSHRDGFEEAVISSSDGMTFFGTRSPAIAFRAAPSERYPNTTPFSTVNERARHPDPTPCDRPR